jgi:hypothetical protein
MCQEQAQTNQNIREKREINTDETGSEVSIIHGEPP